MAAANGARNALVAVVVLLLCAGAAHRWAHDVRTLHTNTYRPPPVPLAEIPAQIGRYQCLRDLPLDEEVRQVARTDDVIYRAYGTGPDDPFLEVYVAYWGHENTGMGHGPEVCYPAVGWNASGEPQSHVVRIAEAGDTRTDATVSLQRFTRLEPRGLTRTCVGFVAVVDGQLMPTSRRWFAHRPPDPARGGFLAHVQVSTNVSTDDWAAAEARILDFMARLIPHVARSVLGPNDQRDTAHTTVRTGE